MADHSELVARLRDACRGTDDCKCSLRQAADAIEALSRENAALTARAEAAEKEAHDCGAERAAWKERAEAAEAKVGRMIYAMGEASDPDFLFGAMDNVNDMNVSLSAFSEAASRAIRAYIEYEAAREIGGGND